MLITTVNDFFGIIDGRFWKEILAGEPGAKVVTDLTAQSAVNVSLDQWPTILSGVAEKAKDLLDVDLSWLIVSGWGKYGELTQYTIADGHNPRDTHLVPLRKHTMSVDYSPFLDLVFTGKPLGKVVFDVRMSFDLEGFVLTIQNN